MAKIIDSLVEYMLAARRRKAAGGSDSKRQKPSSGFAGRDRFRLDFEAGEARLAARAPARRQRRMQRARIELENHADLGRFRQRHVGPCR